MSSTLTYDKNGQQVPSREFLTMMTIMLKKCQQETGLPMQLWIRNIGNKNAMDNVPAPFSDDSLRSSIYKTLKENYLDQEAQNA